MRYSYNHIFNINLKDFQGMLLRTVSKLSLLLITLISVACGQEEPRSGDIRTADLPEIVLNERFILSDTPESVIRQVNHVITNADGEIFISDWGAYKIHHFTQDGEFNTSIGGQGGAVGRFLLVQSLDFDEQNRMIVYDIRQNRHTVFDYIDDDWAAADTFSFSQPATGMTGYLSNGELLTSTAFDERADDHLFQIYHHLQKGTVDGSFLDEDPLRVRGRQMMVDENTPPEEVPLSYRTLHSIGPDQNLYTLNTETFAVQTYDRNLTSVDTVYAPVAKLLIHESDRQNARLQISSSLRHLTDQYLPNTKPVARSFITDEDGRFWIRTYDSPQYMVLDNEGSPLGSFDLPAGFQLHHVSGERLFASGTVARGDEVRVFEFSMP